MGEIRKLANRKIITRYGIGVNTSPPASLCWRVCANLWESNVKKLSLKGTSMSRWACIVGLFFGFFLFGSPPAIAHRVNVFAWAEGNTVHVEGKFPGGRKVKNGQVVVLDADDHKLLDGRTDNHFSSISERTNGQSRPIAGRQTAQDISWA